MILPKWTVWLAFVLPSLQIGCVASETARLNGDALWGLPRSEVFVVQLKPITEVWNSFNNWQHSTQNGMGYEQTVVELPFYELDGEVIPGLAESWRYSKDGRSMVLKIRENVTFNDGVPMTIDDWLFTLDYTKRSASLGILNAAFLEDVTWEAIGPWEIQFHFQRPDFRFHRNFLTATSVCWHPEAKHIWEGRDIKTFKNNPPVGTGPYRLKRCNGETKICIWERRDDYWGGDVSNMPPYVVFSAEVSPEVGVLQWEQGYFDLGTLPYVQYRNLTAKSSNYRLLKSTDPCPRRVVFNADRGLTGDRWVRRALSLLIDRQRSARLLIPPGRVTPLPWMAAPGEELESAVWYDPASIEKYRVVDFDPGEAARILDRAGYPMVNGVRRDKDGNPIVLDAIAMRSMSAWAYILQSDAETIGVQINVRQLDVTNYLTLTATGEGWNMTNRWACVDPADPILAYSTFHRRDYRPIGVKANFNHGRYRNDEMDRLIERMESGNPEDPEIQAVYRQAFDLLYSDAPVANLWTQEIWIPIYTRYWTGLEQGKAFLFGACHFRLMLDQLRRSDERQP